MTPTRILIVEDEFIVASDIEARLLDLGYSVAGKANCGSSAIELAESARPDLVLMDIRLQGAIDGIAAASEIHRRFQLPVVFLTAYAEDDTLQRAKAAEPFGYVLKPFEDRELRTAIEIGIYKHKAEKEIARLSQYHALLGRINHTIIHVRCRQHLFEEICRIGAEVAGFKAVWIGWLDWRTQKVVPVARAGERADYADRISVYADDRPEGRGVVGSSIRQGIACISNDIVTDPNAAPWRETAAACGLRAAVALPIKSAGKVCGALTVYASEPGAFGDREVALLEEVTANISFALDNLDQQDWLRKLACAVEQSSAIIVMTDRAGNIEYVNPKFTQVTGYAPAEVLGKNPRILQSGETPPEEYRHLWETILAGKGWEGEFHNKRKDGSLYWERASISPVRDASGAIAHFVGVKEDLTEKKLLESKFLRAQRLESIGSLASGIAHDLNNILAPILMSAQLMQIDEDPAIRLELAETIQTSAQRATGIVKQLLSFARGQEGKKQPVQVRHLLRDVTKMVHETFPRTIQVEEACATDLWLVRADATQLHQVFLNLCVNARDAMPDGGKLTLRAENVVLDEHYASTNPEAVPGPYAHIQVEDTGTGMTESVHAHIFESFFTTKGEGQGTGLGLTTVLGIVKSHRGFITCTTAPGQGTTFDIYLPATVEAQPTTEETGDCNARLRGRGELVLVVDDEQAVCDSMRRSLERNGYAVVEAHDGIEALAQFISRKDQLRAVVTDFMMPQMDGLTLCRSLRVLSPRTPVIVSSGGLFGAPGTDAVRAFEKLGVQHILHKPHNADVLLQALVLSLRPEDGQTTKSSVP
jgi:PAS domain S-box-containing protein